jgi:hypothetical protein
MNKLVNIRNQKQFIWANDEDVADNPNYSSL